MVCCYLRLMEDNIYSVDVSVSLPAMISVGESGGMMEVCATLSAMEDTQRNFTILLVAEDDTGKLWRVKKIMYTGT